jgi:hypothetical protein
LIVDPPYEWEGIVERGVKEWKGKGLRANLIKLVWIASIYNLWKEKYNIWHRNPLQIEEKIIHKISWEVKIRIVFKGNYLSNKDNEVMCCSWV